MRAELLVNGALTLVALITVAGCGEATPAAMTFSGERVARIAENQLEARRPALAPGVVSCSDLDFVVGARARCARTSALSNGRGVRVLGTVTVMSVRDGGRLHVHFEERAASFWVRGAYLADRARRWLDARHPPAAAAVSCPDLPGETGREVTCEAGDVAVGVLVTATVPETYAVRYRMRVLP